MKRPIPGYYRYMPESPLTPTAMPDITTLSCLEEVIIMKKEKVSGGLIQSLVLTFHLKYHFNK